MQSVPSQARRIPLSPFVVAAACVAALVALRMVPGNARFLDIAVHSTLEAAGAVMGLFAAAVLLAREDFEAIPHAMWLAAALLVSGILDLAHATVPIAPVFFWSRALPTLLGGLLTLLVWLPRVGRSENSRRWVAIAIGAVAIPVAATFHFAPQWWPPMFSALGVYSVNAKLMNVIGGVAYLGAFVYFFRRHLLLRKTEDLVFANQSLLLAAAGGLFMFASLWDPAWWMLHLLRFAGACAVLVYVIDAYRKQQAMLRAQFAIELEEQFEELRARAQEGGGDAR